MSLTKQSESIIAGNCFRQFLVYTFKLLSFRLLQVLKRAEKAGDTKFGFLLPTNVDTIAVVDIAVLIWPSLVATWTPVPAAVVIGPV